MFILVDAVSYNDLVVRHANKLKERNISNKRNRLKNPNWREADQSSIYKQDRAVELGFTEKQLQLSGQSGTWTRDIRISSSAA